MVSFLILLKYRVGAPLGMLNLFLIHLSAMIQDSTFSMMAVMCHLDRLSANIYITH